MTHPFLLSSISLHSKRLQVLFYYFQQKSEIKQYKHQQLVHVVMAAMQHKQISSHLQEAMRATSIFSNMPDYCWLLAKTNHGLVVDTDA